MGSEARDSNEPKRYFDGSLVAHAKTPAQGIAQAVAVGLGADEVHVALIEKDATTSRARFLSDKRIIAAGDGSGGGTADLFTIVEGEALYEGSPIGLPVVVNDLQRARLPRNLASALSARSVRSFGLFGIQRSGNLVGLVACFYKRSFHRWRSDEISAFETLGEALPIETLPTPNIDDVPVDQLSSELGRYKRLAEHGNIVILTTDAQFSVIDVFGNTLKLIGVPRNEVTGDPKFWERVVDPRDIVALGHKILRLRLERGELKHELRVRHQQSGKTRWIFLRALPRLGEGGDFLGWEGFGVDVTEKVEAQEAYLDRSRRLEALFEITRAMEGCNDPVAVALTGLKALIRATQAECGFACFLERDSNQLELVATVGLPERFLGSISPVLRGPSLLRDAVDAHEGFIIGDLQQHPRATHSVAISEGLRSTIMVPMLSDGSAQGALMIFKRTSDGFCDDDFELAEAAALQITVALRQAEMLHIQRRQSASLSSLYKVSLEMAKHRANIDFSRSILPVLRTEFGLRRGWIGLMNETRSFIFGRAGFGPDDSVVPADIQFDVEPGHIALQHVLKTHTPLLVNEPREEIGKPLREFFFDATSLVVVPMVTVGQTMGILVVEPFSATTFASSERLQLLVSMASEIATAMMAGRFDSRAADSHKMRMAGLLASGVAHNFNNLLQAIVGQVSLIEMRSKDDPSIRESTKTIHEAAHRGASLVSQLLRFATQGAGRRRPVQIAEMLKESKEGYCAVLGHNISLTIECQASDATTAFIDPSLVQDVINTMLRNARDAIGTHPDGEVTIAAHAAVVRAGELGPDVSPGTYVRIDVEDNGCGMQPETQARCFEPFFTTKNIDQDTGVGLSGSGLGLSGAYAIIRQHDGHISVHSMLGEGTVFSVYLPACASTRSEEEVGAKESSINRDSKPGVLLLGADAGTQPFLAKTLESLGYPSRAVFDLRQLREVISSEPLAWGYILVDVDSPGANSPQSYSDLAAEFSDVRVIYLGTASGAADSVGTSAASDKEGASSTSPVCRISKPLTVWALEDALRSMNNDVRPMES
jgi:PAS domain S-box-containing protein